MLQTRSAMLLLVLLTAGGTAAATDEPMQPWAPGIETPGYVWNEMRGEKLTICHGCLARRRRQRTATEAAEGDTPAAGMSRVRGRPCITGDAPHRRTDRQPDRHRHSASISCSSDR